MAVPIISKANTDPVSTDWPFGKIRDRSGSTGGTKVDAYTYQDHHQFFAKLMNSAGITPNNLLDNATNGFQLFDSLVKLFDGDWLTNSNVANATILSPSAATVTSCRRAWKETYKDVTLNFSIGINVTTPSSSSTSILLKLPVNGVPSSNTDLGSCVIDMPSASIAAVVRRVFSPADELQIICSQPISGSNIIVQGQFTYKKQTIGF